MGSLQTTIVIFSYLSLFLIQARAYTNLTDTSLKSLSRPGADFDIHKGSILAPILIPRVSGTEGNTKVLEHFAEFFRTQLPDWHIATQNSTSKTPATGERDIPFKNLIVTRDPPWADQGEVSYLTLAAHYDSKLEPDGFIGATDSAAPCAMVMHAARAVEEALKKKWARMQEEGVGEGGFSDVEDNKGLQIILFDGEEAFKHWTDIDSIYGARSLAAEWEETVHPAMSTYRNPLDAISLFVLLDLLGAKDPLIPSYYPTTHWAYQKMAALEGRLRGLGVFKSHISDSKEEEALPVWFSESTKSDDARWLGGAIGDDHVPFLARGVEVLHLIASPFPMVWHTMDDNAENLDMDTVEDWAVLTTAFVSEWMDLEGFLMDEGAARPQGGAQVAPRDELAF